mmetsp:Transcript_11250/g.35707  ORF Transcript_11250/g.35707 Transcript_11250/m.35707 type:complete len:251 (-) Transcript_11250:27-779(-)
MIVAHDSIVGPSIRDGMSEDEVYGKLAALVLNLLELTRRVRKRDGYEGVPVPGVGLAMRVVHACLCHQSMRSLGDLAVFGAAAWMVALKARDLCELPVAWVASRLAPDADQPERWQLQERLERAERTILYLLGFAVAMHVPEDRVWQHMRQVVPEVRASLEHHVARWLVQGMVSVAPSTGSLDDVSWAVVAAALVDSSETSSQLPQLWPSLGPAVPPLTDTVASLAAHMRQRWAAVDPATKATILEATNM